MSQATLPKIGIVGLGRMGANMARRLHQQGFPIVALYDINAAVSQALSQELNSQATQQLADVTAQSDIILTVVSDDQAMETIYHHAEDNLFQQAKGKLFINFATIHPSTHIQLMKEAIALGAHMLEAPMASSITQAKEGTLFLMVAGEESALTLAKPVLNSLAKEFIYTGPAGSAAKVKALVNMVMNINTAGLAEGLGLADALGLDLQLVKTIFSKTGANSRVLETDGDDMIQRDHDTYFSAAHAAKDAGIALALGRSEGLDMVLSEATYKQYAKLEALGKGDLDKSGIAELTFKGRQEPIKAH